MRILIVRLSAIGDVLVTTPVTRAIRKRYPDAHVTWLVEPKAADILSGNPYVDEVLVFRRPRGPAIVPAVLRLMPHLHRRRFDWALDFQGLLRSAVVARLSGARRVAGLLPTREGCRLFYDQTVLVPPDEESARQRCLSLLRVLGIESTDRRLVLEVREPELDAAAQALKAAGLRRRERYACLVPGTTWKQKHWPEEHWARLCRELSSRLGVTPVWLGGPGERSLVARLREAGGTRSINLAGRTSLKSAAAVLQGAELTVAVDTALMHASVAVETPTVGLFGASGWPAYGDYERFLLLREPLACSPCMHRPTCHGAYPCMQSLTPERVVQGALRLLTAQSAPELAVL
jgi:heptosyltransferase I